MLTLKEAVDAGLGFALGKFGKAVSDGIKKTKEEGAKALEEAQREEDGCEKAPPTVIETTGETQDDETPSSPPSPEDYAQEKNSFDSTVTKTNR